MQPRKLNIFFGFPSYGGNGGISSEVPDIREWFVEVALEIKKDERIGEIFTKTIGDTPITMVRNRFVTLARRNKCDVLVMCDSDQHPNFHRQEAGFQPFFPSSFDFLYRHYDRGPVVIGAPYCGPPNGTENCYVFYWDNDGYRHQETRMRLEKYTREQAWRMRGIQECAALPTGLIMYDLRAFELIEPSRLTKREVLAKVAAGEMSFDEGYRNLTEGFFYYEWKDGCCDEKASTEDVTNTRDISMIGRCKLGYNPVHCNWDSPIGHWKPWCVRGRPELYSEEHVGSAFARALERGSYKEKWVTLNDEPWADYVRRHGVVEVKTEEREPAFTHKGKVAIREINLGAGRGVKRMLAYGHNTNDQHLLGLREVIRALHHRKNRLLYGIEIGVWVGESTAMIEEFFDELHCVDPHTGVVGDDTSQQVVDIGGPEIMRDLFRRNVGPQVTLHSRPSPQAADEFDDGAFDVVIIDAAHDYEAVLADIDAWLPKLRPDGYMLGHDYATSLFPGVTHAVRDRFPIPLIREVIPGRQGSYWLVSLEEIAEYKRNNGQHAASSPEPVSQR